MIQLNRNKNTVSAVANKQKNGQIVKVNFI